MAIQEIVPSKDWREERNTAGVTRIYIVNTGNPDAARIQGPAIGTAYPGQPSLLVSNKHTRPISGNKCELRVVYEYRPVPDADVGDTGLTGFDSTAQTNHIVFDLDGRVISSGTEIEGVDVYRPNFIHTEDWQRANVTSGYVQLLYTYTSTINKYPWKWWPARSMLFLGAVGRHDGIDKWSVSYRFMYRPPQYLYDADGHVIGTADGWDYIKNRWIRQTETDPDGNKRMVMVVDSTVVHRVYPDTRFSLLGIGS